MLLKFSVKNYRSFRDVATLDLVSSSKIRSSKSHVINLNGASVLRNAAIYGANAAGKSNLISAMYFMKGSVHRNSLPRNSAIGSCKINSSYSNEESTFDVLFEKNGRFFDYGFSAILGKRTVTSEWLLELSRPAAKTGTSRVVFSWAEGIGFDRATFSSLQGKALSRMEIYASDFMSSQNDALFLSCMNRGKDVKSFPEFSAMRLAYDFIDRDFRVIEAEPPRSLIDMLSNEDSLRETGRLIGSFDTGISGLKQVDMTLDDLNERDSALGEFVHEIMDSAGDAGLNGILRSRDMFLGIDIKATGEAVVREMLVEHSKSDCDFEFSEESDGTKRLFDYLDLIIGDHDDAVFVIDEIDQSLHPMLTRRLIELFNERHCEDRVQLVFTTHETSIMKEDLLRHDEIWFMDRRPDGSSDLFPLDKFKERSDASIEKMYLQGRYGGVPVLRPFFLEKD